MNDERTAKDADATKSTPDAESKGSQPADAPRPATKVSAKKAPAQKPPAGSALNVAKPAVTARRPISKEEYARTTRESADHTSVIPAVKDDVADSPAKPGADADAVTKPTPAKQPPKRAPKKPTGKPAKAAATASAKTTTETADISAKGAPVADPKKADDPKKSGAAKPATSPAPSAVTKSAPKTATKSGAVSSSAGRRAERRALTYVDPWSVSKMTFVVSVALMIVAVVAVVVFWFVLQVTGVWQALNDSVANVLSDGSGTFDVTDYLSLGRLTGLALIVSALNVIFMTALATIAAHLYNLAAGLLGGAEVTFEDTLS